MKIAGVIRLMPAHRGVGGMQGHALNAYSGLAKRGHKVTVFTTEHPQKIEKEEFGNLTIRYLKGTPPAIYSGAFIEALKENVFKESWDIIHSESSAGLSLTEGETPVVATWHGVNYCAVRGKINQEMLYNPKGLDGNFWEKSFSGIVKEARDFRKFDHHIAISHQAQHDLEVIYQIPKASISLVFNGFDSDAFQILPNARSLILAQNKIPPTSFVVGVAGRLTVDKGHRFLIEPITSLISMFPKIHLVIVGEGELAREYTQTLNPSIKNNIHFLGAKSYKEMPSYYNAFDLFLNPTLRYLGLDMTMQEAMLCGTPVLASDTGSIKQSLLPKEEYGEVFKLGDKDSFRAKFEQMMKKRYERKKIRDFVATFSSLDIMCKGMEDAFELVIKAKRIKNAS